MHIKLSIVLLLLTPLAVGQQLQPGREHISGAESLRVSVS